MNIVMIAVHKTGNKIVGFRLLDTDSGSIKDVPSNNAKEVILSSKVEIENLAIEGGRIVGSNGTLQRYPAIVNGKLYGKSPLIILFELSNNCYRVANYLGEIVDIAEHQAINYAQTEGIANGKIVPDEAGGAHISSISGTYKQDKLIADKKYGKTLVAKMKILGVKDYSLDEKYTATVTNKETEKVGFGKGVLGIADNGCRDCKKLTTVNFTETLEKLGEASFQGCISLESIVIPEGIVTIPKRCFAQCKKLKEVYLPNSLRNIEDRAFCDCSKLKVIYCGPAPLNIAYGAIPRGVARKIGKFKGDKE